MGRFALLIILGIILIGLPACSSEERVYTVTGKVTYQGQPAAGALIILHKQGETTLNTHKPTGAVKEDGTFSLEIPIRSGAPAGTYTVTVTWLDTPSAPENKGGFGTPERDQPQPKDKLNDRYRDPTKSKLTYEIKPSYNQPLLIDLE